MFEKRQEKFKLLWEIKEKIKDGIKDKDWLFLKEQMSQLNLPPNNIIFTYLVNKDLENFKKAFDKLFKNSIIELATTVKISENYEDGLYGCDREFARYTKFIENHTEEELIELTFTKLQDLKTTNPSFYELVTTRSFGWYMQDNWLDGNISGNNSLIANRIKVLKNNLSDLIWLYKNLADWLSKKSLNALINFWLNWQYDDWLKVSLYYCDVVDPQIFPITEEEVFVDCGSYVGDTVLQYLNTFNDNYKNIYTYDISSASINIIKANLANYKNITIRHAGTGDKNTEMPLFGINAAHGGNHLSEKENPEGSVEKVRVVKLDDDIKDMITFLKIDVEGMDKETLSGAKTLIQKYHPKLNVDAYHILKDIIEVPKLIKEIDESYLLYLRLPMMLEYEPRFPFATFMAI